MAQFNVDVDDETLERAGWAVVTRANKLRQKGREDFSAKLHLLGRQMVEEARMDEEELEGQFEDSIISVEQ